MAVRFDSTDDSSYTKTSGSFFTPSNYTMCAFIRIATDTNFYSCFMHMTNNAESFYGHELLTDSNGTSLVFGVNGSLSTTVLNMTVGRWYFAGVVYNTSNSTYRLFATPIGSNTLRIVNGSAIPTITSLDRIYIGRERDGGQGWNGNLASFRVWTNRLLTIPELVAESKSLEPINKERLTAYWRFSPSGLSGIDLTGNGYDLTQGVGTIVTATDPPITYREQNWIRKRGIYAPDSVNIPTSNSIFFGTNF